MSWQDVFWRLRAERDETQADESCAREEESLNAVASATDHVSPREGTLRRLQAEHEQARADERVALDQEDLHALTSAAIRRRRTEKALQRLRAEAAPRAQQAKRRKRS